MPGHRVTAAGLAKIARGQWGIESVHWLRDTACAEDASTGYAGNGSQVMAAFRRPSACSTSQAPSASTAPSRP